MDGSSRSFSDNVGLGSIGKKNGGFKQQQLGMLDIYIYICICIYVRMDGWMDGWLDGYVYVYGYVYVHVYVYVYIYIYMWWFNNEIYGDSMGCMYVFIYVY